MLVVPLVREARGLAQPGGDAMRLERFRGAPDDGRKIDQRLDELLFLSVPQLREIHSGRIETLAIDFADPEDSAHPRVRHLHVIDGILLRLFERDVDVEHELRVALPHQEEEPHRVPSDFVDQVANGEVAPGAL